MLYLITHSAWQSAWQLAHHIFRRLLHRMSHPQRSQSADLRLKIVHHHYHWMASSCAAARHNGIPLEMLGSDLGRSGIIKMGHRVEYDFEG